MTTRCKAILIHAFELKEVDRLVVATLLIDSVGEQAQIKKDLKKAILKRRREIVRGGDLVDNLIENNPDFRALIVKSAASPSKPFRPMKRAKPNHTKTRKK